jgi:hypothetical protein
VKKLTWSFVRPIRTNDHFSQKFNFFIPSQSRVAACGPKRSRGFFISFHLGRYGPGSRIKELTQQCGPPSHLSLHGSADSKNSTPGWARRGDPGRWSRASSKRLNSRRVDTRKQP